jgi:hypothetical protein
MRLRRLIGIVFVFVVACSIDPDDTLDDIDEDTVVRITTTRDRDGDEIAVKLDVDGVQKGGSTSEPSCPRLDATFTVAGERHPKAETQGGVSHTTHEGCKGETVDRYACNPIGVKTRRPLGAGPAFDITMADEDATWSIRVDELLSAPPTLARDGEGVLREGDELRVRITPAPPHVENLRIDIVYKDDDRARLARWVAPDVVAFPMPRVRLDPGKTQQDIGVRISIADAFRPHVASCKGPAKCVLDAKQPIVEVRGEIVVPYAGEPVW